MQNSPPLLTLVSSAAYSILSIQDEINDHLFKVICNIWGKGKGGTGRNVFQEKSIFTQTLPETGASLQRLAVVAMQSETCHLAFYRVISFVWCPTGSDQF